MSREKEKERGSTICNPAKKYGQPWPLMFLPNPPFPFRERGQGVRHR